MTPFVWKTAKSLRVSLRKGHAPIGATICNNPLPQGFIKVQKRVAFPGKGDLSFAQVALLSQDVRFVSIGPRASFGFNIQKGAVGHWNSVCLVSPSAIKKPLLLKVLAFTTSK